MDQATLSGSQMLLALAATAALAVSFWALRCIAAWRTLSAIPGPPASHPILGHATILSSEKASTAIIAWAAEYGPIFKLRVLLHQPVVVVSDPAEAKALLSRGPRYLPKARMVYDTWKNVYRPRMYHIVTSQDTPYQRAVRCAVSRCFTSTALKAAFPQFVELTEKMARKLLEMGHGGAKPLNVSDAAKRITGDIIAVQLYGQPQGYTDFGHSEFMEVEEQAGAALQRQMANPLAAWNIFSCVRRADEVTLDKYSAFHLMFAKQARDARPPSHTIAAQLMEMVDPETGKPLSLERFALELGIVQAAGYETSAAALAFALAAIAEHSHVEQGLMQELLDEGLAATRERPQPRTFQFSDLGRLPYLSAVIKEALRYAPPVPVIPPAREVAAGSARACGHVLPRGTVVLTPPASLGRHRGTYGQDVDVFRPERWLASGENGKGSRPIVNVEALSGSGLERPGQDGSSVAPANIAPAPALPENLAFSWGPRDCVGQALARVELQVVLAVLLGRLRFALDPSVGGFERLERERMVLRTTVHFDGGLPMLVRPRTAGAVLGA